MGVGAQAHTALCDKLAEYDVVGCLEDSFAPADIHAYKELKARAGKPVVLHHAPMVRSNPRPRFVPDSLDYLLCASVPAAVDPQRDGSQTRRPSC